MQVVFSEKILKTSIFNIFTQNYFFQNIGGSYGFEIFIKNVRLQTLGNRE